MPEASQISGRTLIWRGLRRLCPRCGRAGLFDGWYHLKPVCPACGLDFKTRSGDMWAAMYFTTAGLIGLVLLLLLGFFKPLADAIGVLPAQLAFVVIALVIVVLTLPYRKGLAIALDYLFDRKLETPK